MAEDQPTYIHPEQWRPIPGYEGHYEASNHGRVRGVGRKVRRKDGVVTTVQGKVLKEYVGAQGYPIVNLSRGGKGETCYVHRLVLESFVGPAPKGSECCHGDGTRTNNHLENLRWGTASENSYDRVRHGTHPNAIKTHCPYGHPLEVGNLKSSDFKDGRRRCLACNRADARVKWYPDLKPYFQEIADSYYQEIINGRGKEKTPEKKRTHCPRNHPLTDPNLMPSQKKWGKRNCWACSKTHNYLSGHPEMKPHFKEISDSYYEQILSEAKPVA